MEPTTELAVAPLYLSRLHLNLRDRRVRRDLSNSQALHRRLLDGFPDIASRADARLLYRVEASRRGQVPAYTVLAQSVVAPDWSRLDPGYLLDDPGDLDWTFDGPAEVKEIGAQLGRIAAGDRLRFRLRANPTKRVHIRDGNRPTGPNGTRMPLFDDEQLHGWITQKATQHGFRVLGARWQPDPVTGDVQRGFKTDGKPLTHYAVLFDGALEVTDLPALRDALASGIGPAKAYGFGLLSLAPSRGLD